MAAWDQVLRGRPLFLGYGCRNLQRGAIGVVTGVGLASGRNPVVKTGGLPLRRQGPVTLWRHCRLQRRALIHHERTNSAQAGSKSLDAPEVLAHAGLATHHPSRDLLFLAKFTGER